MKHFTEIIRVFWKDGDINDFYEIKAVAPETFEVFQGDDLVERVVWIDESGHTVKMA